MDPRAFRVDRRSRKADRRGKRELRLSLRSADSHLTASCRKGPFAAISIGLLPRDYLRNHRSEPACLFKFSSGLHARTRCNFVRQTRSMKLKRVSFLKAESSAEGSVYPGRRTSLGAATNLFLHPAHPREGGSPRNPPPRFGQRKIALLCQGVTLIRPASPRTSLRAIPIAKVSSGTPRDLHSRLSNGVIVGVRRESVKVSIFPAAALSRLVTRIPRSYAPRVTRFRKLRAFRPKLTHSRNS